MCSSPKCLTAASDYVLENVFGDTGAPDIARSSDCAKYLFPCDSRSWPSAFAAFGHHPNLNRLAQIVAAHTE